MAHTAYRFRCRAHEAEIAAAKARTCFVPEGPQAEEENPSVAAEPSNPSFKKRRIDRPHTSRDFWDCYFRQTKQPARRKAHKQQPGSNVGRDEAGSDDDSDDCSFDSWGSSVFSDDEDEVEGKETNADSEQQHPERFYKQAAPVISPALAFQQLVKFVQGLSNKIKEHKGASHLKGFASRKVGASGHAITSKCCHLLHGATVSQACISQFLLCIV